MRSAGRRVLQPGDCLPLKQAAGTAALTVLCLAADQKFMASPADSTCDDAVRAKFEPHKPDTSENAKSIVLLLKFGPFRFFDAGDLTWNLLAKLFCPYNLAGGTVDLYQVTHHGLDLSNNPLVLETLRLTVAVMNNGSRKGCMSQTFRTLKSVLSIQAIYQLHKNLRPEGWINSAPDEYMANHACHCAGNFIKLSAAPDGRAYTLSIPAPGFRQTSRAQSRG